jgi:hypothetical protein
MNKADTAQIAKIALDAVSFSRQHQEPDRRDGMGRFEVDQVGERKSRQSRRTRLQKAAARKAMTDRNLDRANVQHCATPQIVYVTLFDTSTNLLLMNSRSAFLR